MNGASGLGAKVGGIIHQSFVVAKKWAVRFAAVQMPHSD
jgi:hypothetical protein